MDDITGTLDSFRAPLLLVAGLAAALQAGTYYAFAVGVMPGLARGEDRSFVSAMQGINVSIVNPLFLATFVGAPVLAIAAAISIGGPARPWLLTAAGLTVATVVITAAANIPLNDALAAAGDASRVVDPARVRGDFETAWVRWNIARTITATAALACLGWAALRA